MKITALRLWNIAKVGLMAISRNKTRSLLTMLGIIIGVGCVITMLAVGTGASASIQATINSLGTNFIMLFPGAETQGGARMFGESRITEADVNAIREEAPSVAYVSPSVRESAQVVAGDLNWATTVYGVSVDWPFIRAWNVGEGEFITDVDVRNAARVAVLGATVADNLFPAGDAVGSSLRIKNIPFRVVGVLERKGGNMMGQDQDDQIIAPYTTVMKQLEGGRSRIGQVLISARSPELVAQAQSEIDALLRQRHRIGPGQEADFTMRSQEEIASTSAQTSRTLSILLGSAAAISLLVGGIGIMNIMLVSVTERTREIGIRLAIGAKGKHVLLQFLLEAMALSIVGGGLGVALGLLIPRLVTKFAGMPTEVSTGSVLLAFGFAAAIGIFFGYYPARKASRLDPIDALRYE